VYEESGGSNAEQSQGAGLGDWGGSGTDVPALILIMNEWSRTDESYLQRVANLQQGSHSRRPGQ
jgi:hypothetical protein